jgi:acetyltransferase
MAGLRELPPAKLRSLTEIDPARHVALAAMPPGRRPQAWIGVARCIADAGREGCEFALTVADAWQHTGLAGVLMRALMAEARARGFRRMHGEVLANNRPMLTLARQLGFVPLGPAEGGVLRLGRDL